MHGFLISLDRAGRPCEVSAIPPAAQALSAVGAVPDLPFSRRRPLAAGIEPKVLRRCPAAWPKSAVRPGPGRHSGIRPAMTTGVLVGATVLPQGVLVMSWPVTVSQSATAGTGYGSAGVGGPPGA